MPVKLKDSPQWWISALNHIILITQRCTKTLKGEKQNGLIVLIMFITHSGAHKSTISTNGPLN